MCSLFSYMLKDHLCLNDELLQQDKSVSKLPVFKSKNLSLLLYWAIHAEEELFIPLTN